MEIMEIRHQIDGDVCILEPDGRFALGNAVDVQDYAQKLFDTESFTTLILNLSEVDVVDSSGIGVTIFLHKSMDKRGGSLKICCASDYVLDAYALTGINHNVSIFDSEEEALKSQ